MSIPAKRLLNGPAEVPKKRGRRSKPVKPRDINHSEEIQIGLNHIRRHHDVSEDNKETIALMRIFGQYDADKQPEHGKYKVWHRVYGLKYLENYIGEWYGADIYYSMNTFLRHYRRTEELVHLKALYADLDCYKVNDENGIPYTPEKVYDTLCMVYFGSILPTPHWVIFSGRGLQIVWLIEDETKENLPLWRLVEGKFVDVLKEFGADPKARDVSRVLRLPGSYHGKTGKQVKAEYLIDDVDFRYSLQELKWEYAPADKSDAEKRKKHGLQVILGEIRHNGTLYRQYKLHDDRCKDLLKLCNMRNWDINRHAENHNGRGCRENLLFLYRYFQCIYTGDTQTALESIKALNKQFRDPLSENEVVQATESAEEKYFGQIDATSKERKLNWGENLGYRFKNETLIEWLEITPDEEKHFKTIISKSEKYRRREVKRRKNGQISRAEYCAQADERLDKIKELKEKGYGVRAMADKLGCSPSEVNRLMNKLRKQKYL